MLDKKAKSHGFKTFEELVMKHYVVDYQDVHFSENFLPIHKLVKKFDISYNHFYRGLKFLNVPQRKFGALRYNTNNNLIDFQPALFGFQTEQEMLQAWHDEGLSIWEISKKLKEKGVIAKFISVRARLRRYHIIESPEKQFKRCLPKIIEYREEYP